MLILIIPINNKAKLPHRFVYFLNVTGALILENQLIHEIADFLSIHPNSGYFWFFVPEPI